MAEALLITRDDLVRFTALNGNIDTDTFIQWIKVAQDIHIQQYTGTQLLDKIKADIIANTLANPYLDLVETLIPIDEENERARNVAEEARQNLVGLWKAPTQENILNTKWAAYNAVAEYADWTKPVRGNNVDSARAVKTITGLADRFKNKALTLLS